MCNHRVKAEKVSHRDFPQSCCIRVRVEGADTGVWASGAMKNSCPALRIEAQSGLRELKNKKKKKRKKKKCLGMLLYYAVSNRLNSHNTANYH